MTRPAPKNRDQRKPPPAGVSRKAKAPTAASTGGPWWVWLGCVLAITFAVYLPSLDNDFTNWDDNHYVTENPLIALPDLHAIVTTPVDGNYHPLTIMSLALNYQLSQLHPASYHWLSLLLHLGNTALVFLFVRSLLGGGLWAPALTSLLFGIHPMHVESVAWISERKDVLYAFFYLIGLLAYLRYLDDKRWTWFIATFLAFLLSLASKPAAMVFPLTLLAIDWYRRRPFNLGVWLEKAPYVAVSLVAAVLTLHAQKSVGALTDAGLWTPVQKVLFASYGTVMYVLKLFVPTGLSVIYPYPQRLAGQLGAEFYLSFVALVVLLPAVVFLFRRDRSVLFGLMFFFINIVLVLQFFSIGHAVMADRYTYLPYVGLLFALSYWMDSGKGLFADGDPMKSLVAGVLLLLIPVSAYETWKRCDVWQNSETLWNDTIQRYPGRIPDAYFLRGTYYHHTIGRPEAALADYNEALALNPRAAIIWANKGTLLTDMNRPDSAYACLDRAIELDPNLAFALGNRGAIKGQRGDLQGAISDFTRAIAADPRFRDPYENRAVAYYMAREYEKSVADSRRAIELDPTNPNNPALLDAMGLSLQALGRYREAIPEHDAAIRGAAYGDPRIGGYYLNRSLAWRALGDRGRALKDVRQAELLGVTGQEPYIRELESGGGTGGKR